MWYAAIQQLTCFEQGREAAHMISRGYDKYTPEETDAKYDQALRHPPVGCQYIHENFPEHACDGCPMTAPYHKAKLPMMTLAGSSEEMLEKSDYKESLKRMRRRRSGEELPGISWGVAGLDRYTRLRPGELSVVGALPSIGKTAFMVDAAVSLAERGVPVFLFSAETGQSGLEDRLLSRVSGVDSKAIRGELPNPLTDEEAAAVEEAAHILSGWPIYVNYTAASPERILELVEEIVLRDGLDWGSDLVIMFDYLQFVSPTQANEHLDERLIVAKASSEFKYLAKITRHAVGVFSQLRRDTEGEDKPDLTWFSSSGRIGQDADVAMIMTGERVPGAISLRYMDIVKQREGDAGVRTESKFHQRISKFEERVSSTPEAQEGPDLFPGEGNPFE
jgi:replicative DNA helicase